MTPTLEQVLEQARTLPPEEQRRLHEALGQELQTAEQAARSAAVRRIQGKYKDSLSSTEEFMARKREEIELEERRFQARFRSQTEDKP